MLPTRVLLLYQLVLASVYRCVILFLLLVLISSADCSMSEGSDAEGELEDLMSSVEIAPSPNEGIGTHFFLKC